MPRPHRRSASVREWQHRPYPIGPVVLQEGPQLRARVIYDDQLRRQQNLAAGPAQTLVELHILPAFQSLIEDADPLEHLAPPAATKNSVYPARFLSWFRPLNAKAGSAYAKRVRERGDHCARPGSVPLRARLDYAAHLMRARRFEIFDRARKIRGRQRGVRVQPRDHVAGCGGNAAIESRRCGSLWILQHANAR